MISKEEFIDWKQSEVTKAYYQAVDERIEDAKEVLSYEAGKSSDADSFMRGLIYGLREVKDFYVAEQEETE